MNDEENRNIFKFEITNMTVEDLKKYRMIGAEIKA